MKKLIMLSSLVFAAQFSHAGPMDGKPFHDRQPPTIEERLKFMTTSLSLDDKQAAQISKIMKNHEKEFKDTTDKLKALRDQERKEVDAILTDEQKQKMAEGRDHLMMKQRMKNCADADKKDEKLNK